VKNEDMALPTDRAFAASAVEPVPVSPVPASIPSAALDVIAAEMDPYICKLTDKAFSGHHLRAAIAYDRDIRSVAVGAIDMYHGFTCEFSPWERQHVSEYNLLEEMLASAIEARRAATLGAVHESAVPTADAQTTPEASK